MSELYYWHNSVAQYAAALGVAAAVFCGILIVRYLIVRHVARFAKRTKTNLDDLLLHIGQRMSWVFAFVAGAAIGAQMLKFPPEVAKFLTGFFIIVFTFYAGRALCAVVDFGVTRAASRRWGEKAPMDPSIFQLLGSIAKVIIFIFALLLVLQNLGYEVSTLVAGLGIGGIAVAFALQNILGDIFAAISIYLDKPFSVGDFIVIGPDMGRVKSVGLKSTRLETPQGQELIISNKQLTEQRVQNFRRMLTRHVTLHITVSGASSEALQTVPRLIKEVISGIEHCEPENVFLFEISGEGALYEAEYKVAQGDFAVHTRTRQEFIIALKDSLEKAGAKLVALKKAN